MIVHSYSETKHMCKQHRNLAQTNGDKNNSMSKQKGIFVHMSHIPAAVVVVGGGGAVVGAEEQERQFFHVVGWLFLVVSGWDHVLISSNQSRK